MGILNATTDSFWSASRRRGGEFTRPGVRPVPEEIQAALVVTVVKELSRLGRVSVDTQRAAAASAAIEAGASVMDDVSGTLGDVARSICVGYVAMLARELPVSLLVDH